MANNDNSNWRIVHSEASTGWGGQERRILAELQGFRQRGHQVWLLAPAHSEISRRARAERIACERVDFARWKYPWEALRLALWLRRVRPHVVNPHSSRDGWVLGVAARLARMPFIVRTRHIDVEYPNRWLSRHAFTTLADHVVTTSDRIAKHFQEMFSLPDSRVSALPTGIDLQRFSPAGERARIVSDPGGAPVAGMVCVLRSWKGHATFLDAVARLQAAGQALQPVIVGEGPMRERIERMIAERALAGRVMLTGNRDDVPEVLRALNVLVIPSTKHEGVPQIGLQALAVKTPVVGSDVGGIPEIIRPGETGRIFPAGDAGALARAIQETLASAEHTRALADRGRALVESHHSLDRMLDRLDALYRAHVPATT
jgi:glycosyltransferase involved in cell wall biosynthesis